MNPDIREEALQAITIASTTWLIRRSFIKSTNEIFTYFLHTYFLGNNWNNMLGKEIIVTKWVICTP
jgi:hypothetical protein